MKNQLKQGSIGGAIFTIALVIFILLTENLSAEDLPKLEIFGSVTFIVSTLLCILAIKIINDNQAAFRISIIFTVLWLLFVINDYGIGEKYHSIKSTLINISFIVIFWGGVWVARGFRTSKNIDLIDYSEFTEKLKQSKIIKPKNALEEMIVAMYGNPPPDKSAVLSDSIDMAHEELLLNIVDKSKVELVGKGLFSSPIPYTTKELALAIAMNFLKDGATKEQMFEAQLMTRAKMVEWLTEHAVNSKLVDSFESILYKIYKNNTFKNIKQ